MRDNSTASCRDFANCLAATKQDFLVVLGFLSFLLDNRVQQWQKVILVFAVKVRGAQLQQSCPILMRASKARDAFNLEWWVVFRGRNANEVLVKLRMLQIVVKC